MSRLLNKRGKVSRLNTLAKQYLLWLIPLAMGFASNVEARHHKHRQKAPVIQQQEKPDIIGTSISDLTSYLTLQFEWMNPSGKEEQIRVKGHFEESFTSWLLGLAEDERNYTAQFYLIPQGSSEPVLLKVIRANSDGSFGYDIASRYHVKAGDQIQVEFFSRSGMLFARGIYSVS